jgi:hypothetical protein
MIPLEPVFGRAGIAYDWSPSAKTLHLPDAMEDLIFIPNKEGYFANGQDISPSPFQGEIPVLLTEKDDGLYINTFALSLITYTYFPDPDVPEYIQVANPLRPLVYHDLNKVVLATPAEMMYQAPLQKSLDMRSQYERADFPLAEPTTIIEGQSGEELKFSEGDLHMLDKIGYTNQFIFDVFEPASAEELAPLLPVPAYRAYKSVTVEAGTVTVNYVHDAENVYEGGNGLDPFPETVQEYNALILFARVDGLESVSFRTEFPGSEGTDVQTETYTLQDITARFAITDPRFLDHYGLQTVMGLNLQISEYYFAHYSRLYLGDTGEAVKYRNGEPQEITALEDGTERWVYTGEAANGSNEYSYHLDADNRLIVTRYTVRDGMSYMQLFYVLGTPDTNVRLSDGAVYAAYVLREGEGRHGYFILRDDQVVEEGTMFGTDYEAMLIDNLDR